MPRTPDARNRNSEARKNRGRARMDSVLHPPRSKSRKMIGAKNRNSRADSMLSRLSSPETKNISIYENPKSCVCSHRPALERGAYASSRTLSAGCDGRGWYRETSDAGADGEVVWSWHPLAGAKRAGNDPRGDGG